MAAAVQTKQRRGRGRERRPGDESWLGGPRVHALTSVRAPARTRLTFGAVVWAHIPFQEEPTEKTRPAIVIELDGPSVAVLPATSAVSRLRFRDRHVEIDDLGSAGLRRPTGIRLRRVKIDVIDVIDIVGTLAFDDIDRLAQRLELSNAA